MDILSILIIAGILIVCGAIIFFIGSVPAIIFRKKEIKAFGELAARFKFSAELGKAGFKANFPVIKGFYRKRWFFVYKVRNQNFSNIGHYRIRLWTLRIATKIKNPIISNLLINCKSTLKNKPFVSDFYKYIDVHISPTEKLDEIINESVKEKILQTYMHTGVFYISLADATLFTSNEHGLYNSNDVEKCSKRLELLFEIAESIENSGGNRDKK